MALRHSSSSVRQRPRRKRSNGLCSTRNTLTVKKPTHAIPAIETNGRPLCGDQRKTCTVWRNKRSSSNRNTRIAAARPSRIAVDALLPRIVVDTPRIAVDASLLLAALEFDDACFLCPLSCRVFHSRNCEGRHVKETVLSTRCQQKTSGLTGGINIVSLFSPDKPRRGVLILVEALQREGVTDVFTHKDQSIILRALMATSIQTHTFLNISSELLAAIGYAMASGLPGVCMTSWISAGFTYEFIHGIDYARENGIPLVVMMVDGWEKEEKIRETSGDRERKNIYVRYLDDIAKSRFHITYTKDIPKIVREALLLARSGRPGPVVIDRISYDSVNESDIQVWDVRDDQEQYTSATPTDHGQRPTRVQLEKVIGLLKKSKRPLLCAGSGCFEWGKELTRFVDLTGIPVITALESDTPVYLTDGDFSHDYLSVKQFDLLLALDIGRSYYDNSSLDLLHGSDSIILKFDVGTGDCEEAAEEETSSLLDVLPVAGSVSSIRCDDMKSVLQRLTNLLVEANVDSCLDFSAWRREINDRVGVPTPDFSDEVKDVLNDVANRGDTFICTTYQDYRVRFWDWFVRGYPPVYAASYYMRYLDNDCMVVTLPLAAGAAIGKDSRRIQDHQENQMNIIHVSEGVEIFMHYVKDLVVLKRENLPVKIVILNDVLNNNDQDTPPINLSSVVGSFEIPYRRITKVEEVRDEMLVIMDTPGPFVLDIIVPYCPDSCFDVDFTYPPPYSEEFSELSKAIRNFR